jgi:hypothetical protein
LITSFKDSDAAHVCLGDFFQLIEKNISGRKIVYLQSILTKYLMSNVAFLASKMGKRWEQRAKYGNAEITFTSSCDFLGETSDHTASGIMLVQGMGQFCRQRNWNTCIKIYTCGNSFKNGNKNK